jgi:hypothetical protein
MNDVQAATASGFFPSEQPVEVTRNNLAIGSLLWGRSHFQIQEKVKQGRYQIIYQFVGHGHYVQQIAECCVSRCRRQLLDDQSAKIT